MTSKNNQGGNNSSVNGPPFYMVEPAGDINGKKFIDPQPDGTFHITVQVALFNRNDNNTYDVVRFVNGKLLPGTIKIDKRTQDYTFENVKPDKNGVELVICWVKYRDPDKGTPPLAIGKDKFKPIVKPVSIQKSTINVKVGPVGPDGYHTVVISLFRDGNPVTGVVEITAGQEFMIATEQCPGYKSVDVSNANGVSVRIKAMTRNEGFSFTNSESMESVRRVLLKR